MIEERLRDLIEERYKYANERKSYWAEKKFYGRETPDGEPPVSEVLMYWNGYSEAFDFIKHIFNVLYGDCLNIDDVIRKYGETMSLDELSHELGYAKQTVYQKAHKKEILGIRKVGNRLLFNTKDVAQAIIERQPFAKSKQKK
jgi:hypothetical protein